MRRLLFVIPVLALALTACGTADDTGSQDPIGGLPTADATDGDPASGSCLAGDEDCTDESTGLEGDAASGSCLAGDEGCTDESYSGQDVTREVVVGDELPTAEEVKRGEARDATGRTIDMVVPQDDGTLGIAFTAGACDVVQDVLVQESDTEVRLLVLSGIEMSVDMCTQQLVQYTTVVTLEAPLGERTVLDISG